MYTKRDAPHKGHRDPEAIGSLAFFIAEFTHKASDDDWSLLLQTLVEW